MALTTVRVELTNIRTHSKAYIKPYVTLLKQKGGLLLGQEWASTQKNAIMARSVCQRSYLLVAENQVLLELRQPFGPLHGAPRNRIKS